MYRELLNRLRQQRQRKHLREREKRLKFCFSPGPTACLYGDVMVMHTGGIVVYWVPSTVIVAVNGTCAIPSLVD